MSARRPRRHFGEEPEKDMGERWMASYMDMVTVLMCMFIVLYAMSAVDEGKYEQLRNSLAEGFGVAHVSTVDTATGVIVPPDLLDEKEAGSTDLELAALEVDDLTSLREKIRESLQKKGLAAAVRFELDQRGLTIRLIGSETFFETNKASLTGEAGQVLDSIGPIIVGTPYQFSVEGHADLRQSSAPYATNWELSSARATAVLRHLVEADGVPAERIAAVGYGSARPIAEGAAPEDLSMNRRVDVVVLSQQPDKVRALIAGALGLDKKTEPAHVKN